MTLRIKELRLARKWTVEELAEKTGLSQAYVTRLENGQRGKHGLRTDTAEKLMTAFGLTDPRELMAKPSGANSIKPLGLHEEEAEPYTAQDDDLLNATVKRRANVVPYVIKSNSLDEIDISAGDIVFLDISAEAVDNIQPMDAVIAQLGFAQESDGSVSVLMKARTLLRQFVPPSLLITNSRSENAPPMNLATDLVSIMGVIIGKHTSFRKRR